MDADMSKTRKYKVGFSVAVCLVFLAPFFFKEAPIIPVQGATINDWNHQTFWYEPWGSSGVHKGIDIFAAGGTPVIAPVAGWVVFTGSGGKAGNYVGVLGPKWRIHYFSHLNSIRVSRFDRLAQGMVLGTVGSTGNAAGKPAHLHYSLLTLVPYLWRWDVDATQGYKKVWFLSPHDYLIKASPS